MTLALPVFHQRLLRLFISDSEDSRPVIISKAFMLLGSIMLLGLRILIPLCAVYRRYGRGLPTLRMRPDQG